MSFQGDLDQIIAEPPPQVLRLTSLVLAGLLLCVTLIAAFMQIDMVVTGAGHLSADQPTIVLQPMERSIVKRLLVRPGDAVTRGQLLASLDPTFAQADATALSGGLRSVQARLARLLAEQTGTAPPTVPDDADAVLQNVLFTQRRAEYASKLATFDAGIKGDDASMTGARNAAIAAARQVTVARDVELIRAGLWRQQVGSRLNLLVAQAARMQAEHDLTSAQDKQAEITQQQAARQADRMAFVQGWRRDVMEQTEAARDVLQKLQGAATKATLLRDLISIRAPQDGVVLQVANRPGGAVVKEAEPLVTLLPSGAGLMAEIDIGSADIGTLQPGNKVDLKVDAVAYQQHGMLHGTVSSVGEESFPAADAIQGAARSSSAFHHVRITISSDSLHGLTPGTHPLPGMTLNAEIHIGARNLLGYFLYPVMRGLTESMREP